MRSSTRPPPKSGRRRRQALLSELCWRADLHQSDTAEVQAPCADFHSTSQQVQTDAQTRGNGQLEGGPWIGNIVCKALGCQPIHYLSCPLPVQTATSPSGSGCHMADKGTLGAVNAVHPARAVMLPRAIPRPAHAGNPRWALPFPFIVEGPSGCCTAPATPRVPGPPLWSSPGRPRPPARPPSPQTSLWWRQRAAASATLGAVAGVRHIMRPPAAAPPSPPWTCRCPAVT